jgi:hypothetical protein
MQGASGPTTAEFIVSLGIVGVLGPILAILASRWADRRKFAHERKLKASDDLLARVDEVAAALDRLHDACSEVWHSFFWSGPQDTKETWTHIRTADEVYWRARSAITRLEIRPHADSDLLAAANAASSCLLSVMQHIRTELTRTDLSRLKRVEVLDRHPEKAINDLEDCDEKIRQYQQLAREAVAKLLA